ncbi:MAG: sarcosine oxidase subunit gamma family protein [Steroidobacteraceae bacterium]
MTERAIAPAWPISLPGLEVRERREPFSVLRTWRPDAAVHSALGGAFGLEWPVRPNTQAAAGSSTVLWLTPMEWAIVGLEHAEAGARAGRALGGALHDVVDVGDGRVCFAISGDHAGELLAKGCSLDLHPRAFAADACAQTLLAQVPVLLARAEQAGTGDPVPALRVWADASLAPWLRAWLSDAALEYA